MYSISDKLRQEIHSQKNLKVHYSSTVSNEIEKAISATLPPMSGLISGLSSKERNAVYSAAVHKQRKDFVEKNGNDFGSVELLDPMPPK